MMSNQVNFNSKFYCSISAGPYQISNKDPEKNYDYLRDCVWKVETKAN